MIINSKDLLALAPIKNMVPHKETNGIVSHGMSEAGYDIQIKQTVIFKPRQDTVELLLSMDPSTSLGIHRGNFTLASATEEFDMPLTLAGIVHDKSSWARKGLSVFNTVIEPGWKGFLTLELVYHGSKELIIPAGSGIAQVIFHEVKSPAQYTGKYQNQGDEPTKAR